MSTMNPNGTRTWGYLSSLWSALKLNFAEWQRRALSRRLTRTAADIEANKVFWPVNERTCRMKFATSTAAGSGEQRALDF
jgi:hypothetical protein